MFSKLIYRVYYQPFPVQKKALIHALDTLRLSFHDMKQAQLDRSFNSESKIVAI